MALVMDLCPVNHQESLLVGRFLIDVHTKNLGLLEIITHQPSEFAQDSIQISRMVV